MIKLQRAHETMVEAVKTSKKGRLLRIKEVSDIYREQQSNWDDRK